jgi:hypothetical protein
MCKSNTTNIYSCSSTGKILEENLVQSAFQQILGDKFTFQQDNNLIYTGDAYQNNIEFSRVA